VVKGKIMVDGDDKQQELDLDDKIEVADDDAPPVIEAKADDKPVQNEVKSLSSG